MSFTMFHKEETTRNKKYIPVNSVDGLKLDGPIVVLEFSSEQVWSSVAAQGSLVLTESSHAVQTPQQRAVQARPRSHGHCPML